MNLQPVEQSKETPQRLKWRKLETIAQVRLALSVVVKKCFDGKLSPDVANACTNTLRALGKTLHDSDLEARVSRIEQRTNQ